MGSSTSYDLQFYNIFSPLKYEYEKKNDGTFYQFGKKSVNVKH